MIAFSLSLLTMITKCINQENRNSVTSYVLSWFVVSLEWVDYRMDGRERWLDETLYHNFSYENLYHNLGPLIFLLSVTDGDMCFF